MTIQKFIEKHIAANYPDVSDREKTIVRTAVHLGYSFAEQRLMFQLPNKIDLLELQKLLKFSGKYEISIQFWPEQIAVYIAKDGVALIDFGGDAEFAVGKSIEYLNRITGNG